MKDVELRARARAGPLVADLGRYAEWQEGEPKVRVRIADGPAEASVAATGFGRYPVVPEPGWSRWPDLELLRLRRIGPAELHPLVRAGLFPDEPASARAGSSRWVL